MAGKKSGFAGGAGRAGPEAGPGLLAQVVAEYFLTVAGVALVATAIVGWAIYQKIHAELEVPAALYVYLAATLGLAALAAVVRVALGDAVLRVNQRQGLAKESRFLVKEAARCLAGATGTRLSPEAQAQVREAAAAVEAARAKDDWERTESAVKQLDTLLDQHFTGQRKSTTREYAESIVVAVLIALVLRSFVIEAFKIPSGSMIPTLLVGDHIFVNKFLYGVRIPWTNVKLGMGLREPKRGEVIVFKFPRDQEKDFIKRIVAIAGDTVEIRDNLLYVNDAPATREHLTEGRCEYEDYDEATSHWEHRRCDAWRETLDGHSFRTYFDRGGAPRSWPRVTVPPGTVFVMGDNRDNSHDSRYWGTVPYDLIKGKAMIIWFSSGEPEGLRLGRFFRLID